MMNPFDKVAIAGIGETRVGRIPGVSGLQFQVEAARLALEDAGLSKDEVDGLFSFGGYSAATVMHSLQVSEYMGIRPNFNAQVDVGGLITPMTAIFNAASAISSSMCSVVLCTFGENAASYRPPQTHGWHRGAFQGGEEFEDPYGAASIVISYALLAQRHMYEYGTTSEQLGAVAVSARKHAAMNPNAHMREPITIEDHQRSRLIASPLRLLDCSLISDGGGAVVVTSVERARDLRKTPISILGFAMKSTHKIVSQAPGLEDLALWEVGRRIFQQSGLTLRDVDVAEIHDAFTISTVLALEGFGFCARGEGGPYAAEGKLELGGPLPVNTHGGLLSHAHVGGIFHLTEAVKQLRGECGPRQVPGAQVALVSGNGGVFSICGAMLLGRGSV
jgi:acetyl-CoA acetyltransferase